MIIDILQLNNEHVVETEKYLNKIINGDCLEIMKKMPDKSIDIIITSPPYNLLNSTGNGLKKNTTCGKWKNAAIKNGYTDYNDNMPYDKYIKWQKECVAEMFRLIKDDGAIFYNNKNRVQGGVLQDLEVDKWFKCKDGWSIGISCKRTLRERWKQLSQADRGTLSRFKIKELWHLITYDKDLTDDKIVRLGEQG